MRFSFFSSSLASLESLSFASRKRSPKLTPLSFSLSSSFPASSAALSANAPVFELSPSAGVLDPDLRLFDAAPKPYVPPVAYAENAFDARAGVPWRDGERLRPRTLVLLEGGGGDFGRFAALAKGDVADANASKPVRFCGEEEEEDAAESVSLTVAAKGEALDDAKGDVDWVAEAAQGDEDDCFEPNTLGPFTEANGELVEAYAIKPP